jgi:hypothetical protein
MGVKSSKGLEHSGMEYELGEIVNIVETWKGGGTLGWAE